jgi:ubiquinone/menaquinone biosynthesis C-methylase UbiE
VTPSTHDTAGTDAFKEKDAASYDQVAFEFECLAERYALPIADKVVELAAIAAGARALDVGCGTGIVARQVARRGGPLTRVIGIDLSTGMLQTGRALVTAEGLGEQIELRVGDAESLEFADASFDAVLSLYALRHFPNPDAAVREIFRVCRPGGRAVIAVGSAPQLFSAAFLRAGFTRVHESIARLVGRAPLRAPAFLDGLLDEYLPEQSAAEEAEWTHGIQRYSASVAALMRAAGFRSVRASWTGQESAIESIDDFWTLQVVLSSRARKRVADASAQDAARLREAFNALCRWHLERGGRLLYRSGALLTVGERR